MPLLMLVMVIGGLLLALLAQSWAPLLGATAVVALIFMGVLLICSVLVIVVLSAVAVREWWTACGWTGAPDPGENVRDGGRSDESPVVTTTPSLDAE